MTYLAEFHNAIAFSSELGVQSHIEFTGERYLTPEKMGAIPYAIRDALGELTEEEVVAQCVSINLRLIRPLANVLGIEPLFTIGYVQHDGSPRFKQPETYFRELAAHGLGNHSFDAHAWLTLPSMEILDFSFPTSMAVLNGWREGRGMVIGGHADELKHDLSFHPQVVGEASVVKLGLAKIVM